MSTHPFSLVDIEPINFWFFHHFRPNTCKLTFSAEDLKCVDSCYSILVFLYCIRKDRRCRLMTPSMSLRSFIEKLESEGDLRRISAEVDPFLEITEITN